MAHTRSRETISVRISDIVVDNDFKHDPRFFSLVKQDILHKINIGLTRLPADEVISGAYIREGGKNVHISNLRHEHVGQFVPHIRSGGRPSVEVYWNTLAPAGGSYVSPDSEVILAAYIKLGFKKIPARILRPIQCEASEGAIWIGTKKGSVELVRGVAPTISGYDAYKEANNVSRAEAFKYLLNRCTEVRNDIISFHLDGVSELNYHEMIHAVVRRHARLLDSIQKMIDLGRLEHAYVLTRTAYEAFLNFYIDWLSPEFFGPRLQLLSAIRMKEPSDASADGVELLGNFISFLENVSEKSRVSVLGRQFYDSIYAPLSRVVHQSYAYIEREADSFKEEPDDAESVDHLMSCLNVLTAALVERVLNEVGK